MTPLVVALLSTMVIGLPTALILGRRMPAIAVAGMAFLFGSGIVYFALLTISPFGWTLPRLAMVVLIVAAVTLTFAIRGPAPAAPRIRATIIDFATVLTLAGYALFATVHRAGEWDFWAIWGLKARVFLEHGGIDWSWLGSVDHSFAHPDYPTLLPLLYDFAAMANGGWDDRWMGLVTFAFAAAFVAVVRGLAALETTPWFASAIAFGLTGIACTPRIGLAEAPLIAFAGTSLLMIRRGLLFDDDDALLNGAILLGLAGSTKNEGLALFVAVGVAMVVARAWRRIWRLWPGIVIVMPWLLLCRAAHLHNDLVTGSVIARLVARLTGMYRPILGGLLLYLQHRWFWLALVVAIFVARGRDRERFIFSAVAVQLAIYIATYLYTPYDVLWQIDTSWDRIALHVLAPAVFAAALLLANQWAEGDDAQPESVVAGTRNGGPSLDEHGEARPHL
ncbi:MAG: hypothetical protein ABI837_03055 [Acidobacteriota bacterium]